MNWKFLKKIVGWVLIILGLLAFLTPLTPGGWLLFIGAELVGIEMLSQRRVTEYYRKLQAWLRREKAPAEKEDT